MGGMMASCDTDQEAIALEEVQKPYTYADLYYQNLRDYKATDHSIAFGWFAEYGDALSPSNRFTLLPDSLDICSLWGGIPTDEGILEDMRFTQKVKGTKMVSVAITHVQDNPYQDVMDAFNAATDKEGKYEACRMYAMHLAKEVFENDLDGFDADYEPNGDYMSGAPFDYFMAVLNLYMGPYNKGVTPEQRYKIIQNAEEDQDEIEGYAVQTPEDRLKAIQEAFGTQYTIEDCDKMLCVDDPGDPEKVLVPYVNWFFKQSYGGGTSTSWPINMVVFCENVGDNWQGTLSGMYNQAKYQPSTGRKGGFGAFFIHRDSRVHENNPEPYYRFRECIQIQNPAVH